jgi:precorrin-6A synthase (deacetylating)
MIKTIRVIGIGSGNPDHLTGEAVGALNRTDVLLVAGTGSGEADLVRAGTALCAAVIDPAHSYRLVEVPDPPTTPGSGRDSAAYDQDVHDARVEACAQVLAGLGPHEESAGFLVWGDPAIYDSTIRVVDALRGRFDVEHEIIPGISAPQLLAARHRIPLGTDGASIHVTTGRRLVAEYDPRLGDVVVMLDDDLSCAELATVHPDLPIYWGADLGGPDEALVAGPLGEVLDEIREARAAIRARRGRVADTYLLRPPPGFESPPAAVWPPVGQLSDGTVTLRPMTEQDWPVVLAEHNNPEQLRWSLTGAEATEAQARAIAAAAPVEWVRGPGARFVIVDVASGARAGLIAALRIGPPDVAMIGYGIVPDFRGRGFTTRALVLLAQWVFATTSVNRLELGHKDGNDASGRAAVKAGFVREGRMAGRLRNPDGTFSDEIGYGLVRPRPPAAAPIRRPGPR